MSGANPPSSPTAVERPAWWSALFSAWKISAPQRSASAKVGAPTGMTMNSWKSIAIVGVGPAVEDVHHRHRQQVRVRPRRHSDRAAGRRASAAALAVARLTPRIALAPSRPLFSVPSSAIIAASISAWSSASRPTIASAISPLTAATALLDALAAPAALVAVAQLDRLVRAGRRARRAPRRGPCCRLRA